MFSQTVEYALRAMMCLAEREGAPVTAERIALQTRVPAGYLSKVMRDLVVASLVSSFRGPGGGFVLARGAADISILDVVNAVDPIRRIQKCPIDDPNHAELCPLHRHLDDALENIERVFAGTTLAELRSLSKSCRSPATLSDELRSKISKRDQRGSGNAA
jgi:Rrf2 family protein